MGMNFYSCCHKCKVKVFHFRGQENETMIPFYKLHSKCMEGRSRSVETLQDIYQERDWMNDFCQGGYKDQWEYDLDERKYIFEK